MKIMGPSKQSAAEVYFSPWEDDPIDSWKSALETIDTIIDYSSNRTYVWRGQTNASWSLHSGLYRKLIEKGNKNIPTEDELLAAEIKLRNFVRQNWRFDDQPFLQILAQLQHFRAPTRLLDVTLNPLVALWFSVERNFNDDDGEDARLFVFDVTNRQISLDEKYSSHDIPWIDDAKSSQWCREKPLFWRPPAYNDRIPAQQAGFLLAGVPKSQNGTHGLAYRKGPTADSEIWSIDEVRAATSVPFRPFMVNRKHKVVSQPSFTIRISGSAKKEIRNRLERFYGLNQATMYPDPFGMAFETRKLSDAGELF